MINTNIMEPESSSQFGRKKYLDAKRIIVVGDEEYLITEQITKADRLTHVTPFAEKAKPAPRYGGLVPPFYLPKDFNNDNFE